MSLSPALLDRLIDILSDWQDLHVHERYAFIVRAKHLVGVIDEVREKEAAERQEKAA